MQIYESKNATSPKAIVGETRERLLALLRAGHSLKAACAQTGVRYSTLLVWLSKGGDPESKSKKKCAPHLRWEPYWTFARELRAAQAAGRTVSLPGPRRGRLPAPLSPEQQAVILDGLERGLTYHALCRQAGVRLSTFVSWLRLGGYPRPLTVSRPLTPDHIVDPYKSFAAAVLAAEERYFGAETERNRR